MATLTRALARHVALARAIYAASVAVERRERELADAVHAHGNAATLYRLEPIPRRARRVAEALAALYVARGELGDARRARVRLVRAARAGARV